jgi:hypothetical protein
VSAKQIASLTVSGGGPLALASRVA